MKWILPVSIFLMFVYLLKQIDTPQPRRLVTEELPIEDIFCGKDFRQTVLKFSVQIKPRKYRFRASFKPAQCDDFLRDVKNGDSVKVTYYPSGYKKFALARLIVNRKTWVNQ